MIINYQIIQFLDNKMPEVAFSDGYFIAPAESGIYYYGISGSWLSKDGKFSEGSTTSVFAIEVN